VLRAPARASPFLPAACRRTDAGTLAATLEKISVNIDSARRYIRAVKTIGGTVSPEFLLSCTALGVKQYR